MRCEVCGRPVRVNGVLSEALLPGEPEDQGCDAELTALFAQRDSKGAPVFTFDQARAIARENHVQREYAGTRAKAVQYLTNNAAGLDGEKGTPLPGKARLDVNGVQIKIAGVPQFDAFTAPELAAVKAQAQARLDELTKPPAETVEQRFKRERGLQ